MIIKIKKVFPQIIVKDFISTERQILDGYTACKQFLIDDSEFCYTIVGSTNMNLQQNILSIGIYLAEGRGFRTTDIELTKLCN